MTSLRKSSGTVDNPFLLVDSWLALFHRDFPDLVDKKFSLTFKTFKRPTYYIEDVPEGMAYVWFQRHFDGNRITQFPIAVDLKPEMGAVNRLDITVKGTLLFHTL